MKVLFLLTLIFLSHEAGLEACFNELQKEKNDKVFPRKKFSELFPKRWYTRKLISKEVEYTLYAFSTRKDLTYSIALQLYKTLLQELPPDSGATKECHRIMLLYATIKENLQHVMAIKNMDDLFTQFFNLESYDASSFPCEEDQANQVGDCNES